MYIFSSLQGRIRKTQQGSISADRYYFLSSKVKTDVKTTEPGMLQRQTWEQALSGLRCREESYAVLLSSRDAELYYLRIEDPDVDDPDTRTPPPRCIKTYTKKYHFHTNLGETFNTSGLLDFMLDLYCVMYKTARTVYGEMPGSSNN